MLLFTTVVKQHGYESTLIDDETVKATPTASMTTPTAG